MAKYVPQEKKAKVISPEIETARESMRKAAEKDAEAKTDGPRIEAGRLIMTGLDPTRVAIQTGYTAEECQEFAKIYKDVINQTPGAKW